MGKLDSYTKRMTGPLSYIIHKNQLKKNINSKWIEDINIRPETIKFLEENMGRKLFDITLGNDLLDLMPKAKATKAKIKMELHQTKKFLHRKTDSQQN